MLNLCSAATLSCRGLQGSSSSFRRISSSSQSKLIGLRSICETKQLVEGIRAYASDIETAGTGVVPQYCSTRLNKPRRSLLLHPCYQSSSTLKIQEQMVSIGSETSARQVHVHAEALTQMNPVAVKCRIRDTTVWLKMRKGQCEQTKTTPKADQRRSDANDVRTLPQRQLDRSVKSLGVNQVLTCATTDWLRHRRDVRTYTVSREAQLTKDAGEGSPELQYK